MRKTVFYGDYEVTIDEKNRLLVPAEVRRCLDAERDGNAFFIVIGANRRPWFYPENGYEALVGQVEPRLSPDSARLEQDQLRFAMASRAEWDKQGRILIPEATRRRTELGREVTLIGVGNHLELWSRADWEARRDDLYARSSEIHARADQESSPVGA